MKLRLLASALGAIILLGGSVAAQAVDGDGVEIRVLSNRADLISGDNALVRIVTADPSTVQVALNGGDVTQSFAVRPNGELEGVVTGLVSGRNELTATSPSGGARVTITNHPRGGPVFAGAQVQPWPCTTQDHGLGPAQDAQCNAPTVYSYKYKSSLTGQFAAYDPSNPPLDLATTTTDQGRTVPYIVRVERGTMDRGIYDIAALYDPRAPWQPWAPQPGWNHKLFIPFGESCAPRYRQEPPNDVLYDLALSRGFVVAANGLNTLGQNCNPVVSAEALLMLKEHIQETYGSIRYTLSDGCSGGSIQQHNISSAYPGLLDGIMPSCSYPDVTTTGNEVIDCKLLLHYFNDTSPHLWAVQAQRKFVEGSQTGATCHAWINVFRFDQTANPSQRGNTFTDCAVPAEQEYDAETNPDGVRCSVSDYQVAIWGRRDSDGFAKRPLDNVGIQYGLNAVNSGLITPEQFVDLNEKIGGIDIDSNFQAGRSEADPGSLTIAYRGAQVTDGRQLAKVPIIDLRGTSNNEIHTDYHSLRSPGAARPRRRRPRQPGHLDQRGRARRRRDSQQGGVSPDGPVGLEDRGRREQRPARGEGRPREAGRRRRRLLDRRAEGHRHEHVPVGFPVLRLSADRSRRPAHERHHEVPDPAACPRRLQRQLHRRPVGATGGGLRERRVRLEPAQRRPATRPRLADLRRWPRRRAARASSDLRAAALEPSNSLLLGS